jgi:hypothetical protein
MLTASRHEWNECDTKSIGRRESSACLVVVARGGAGLKSDPNPESASFSMYSC